MNVANVADYDDIRPTFDGQDAMIYLAAYPTTDGTWEEVLHSNIVGARNALATACDAGVEMFIFASSIHTVGMYEEENAPDVYKSASDDAIDHEYPERPDSYYGASKSFGEDLGRYYVGKRSWPERFYALRITSIREKPYDHLYGDAEKGVNEGRWERGSEAYRQQVERLKSTWQSQLDLAHQMECCLQDNTVKFDVLYGVSDNDTRFFDIDHAREKITVTHEITVPSGTVRLGTTNSTVLASRYGLPLPATSRIEKRSDWAERWSDVCYSLPKDKS